MHGACIINTVDFFSLFSSSIYIVFSLLLLLGLVTCNFFTSGVHFHIWSIVYQVLKSLCSDESHITNYVDIIIVLFTWMFLSNIHFKSLV